MDPDKPEDAKPEGVRIIGAEEAAEAAQRGDVKQRRSEGEKGFGDRPEEPDTEDRPAFRFPRSQAGDPDRFGAVPIIKPGMPPPPEVLQEQTRDDSVTSEAPPAEDVAPTAASTPPAFEPPAPSDVSGEVELPHWTEPATGQVPKVVAPDASDDELDAWSSLTSVPRWREGEDDYDTGDTFEDLMSDETRVGALDEERIGAADEIFFDDFEDVDDRTTGMQESLSPRGSRPAAKRPPSVPVGTPLDAGSPPERDLGMAAVVGAILALAGIGCFLLGSGPTLFLVTLILAASALELFNAMRQAGLNPATFFGLAGVVSLPIAAYTDTTAAYPIVGGLIIMFGLLWYLFVTPGDRPVANLGVTLLGIAYVGGLGSFAGLMLGLGRLAPGSGNIGIGMITAAVLAAVSYDVGALLIGRSMGRTPLTDISPTKTQEGLVGGVFVSLVTTVIVINVIGDVDPFGPSFGDTFVLALACAVAAPLGDLCESALKRDLDVKDMGSILPGHGGLLDRFDAVLFTLPVTYFVASALDYFHF